MTPYCEIFVRGADEGRLVALVEELVSGRARAFGAVDGERLSLDVRDNDDHQPSLAERGLDEFLHFPFMLEIESRDPAMPVEAFVVEIQRLLDGLYDHGYSFVTVDFEDSLRNNGKAWQTGGSAG